MIGSMRKVVSDCFHFTFKLKPNFAAECEGAQWLSGRVLDSRPRGRGFESHWCHCVVVAKHIYPSLVLVQPYITERFLMGRKESNQTNKNL